MRDYEAKRGAVNTFFFFQTAVISAPLSQLDGRLVTHFLNRDKLLNANNGPMLDCFCSFVEITGYAR